VARFDVDERELRKLAAGRDMRNYLQQVGDVVADRARSAAPKATGAGAESIRAEVRDDTDGPGADVSWDQDHFYLTFHELGTQHQPARPFLRPALDRPVSI